MVLTDVDQLRVADITYIRLLQQTGRSQSCNCGPVLLVGSTERLGRGHVSSDSFILMDLHDSIHIPSAGPVSRLRCISRH
jgi:hypothetical protein